MRTGRHLGRFDRARSVFTRPAERPSGGAGSARSFLTGAAVGGTLAYLLDRQQGHRRRRLLVDRAVSARRRSSRQSARAIRIAVARAEGRAKGFHHWLRPSSKEPPDDVTLSHKVESIVFRDPKFPKGQISINAEAGEVFLRGQVDRPELIGDLEEAVRKVPGVHGVENLLHLPGTPAPTSHAGRPPTSRN
jgi:BON domain